MPGTQSALPTSDPAPAGRRRHRLASALGGSAAALLVAGVALSGASPAHAAEATVGLGTARSFAVLAGSTLTNTGPSVISGDVGISPGTSGTGLPTGVIVNGTTHVADGVAATAQADLRTAYDDAAGRSTTEDITGVDLGGRTLVSGVYEDTSDMQLTGTVTLDAKGDPNAVFIFQAGSTLVTDSNARVALANGASACNVFWQVGSSATLGTGTDFVGTVMALTSVSLLTGADVEGRVLARNGAVTLDTNDITAAACAGAPAPTPTGEPSSTDESSGETSDGPTDDSTDDSTGDVTGGGDGGPDGPGTPAGPTVPVGHPETGLDPSPADRGPLVLYGLAVLAILGAAVAFRQAMRTPHTH